MMMKIAFLEVKDWEAKYLKAKLTEHECIFSPDPLDSAMLSRVKDATVISPFIRSRISREVVSALPDLKLVATRSTGFDHIDLTACADRGITVSNVPSYGENTVAEHTFALMLALSRKIPQTYARVSSGHYSLEGLTGFDIKGKTLGVVGAGRIGMHVIKIARGFGMNVLAYDVFRNSFLAELLGFNYVELDDLLRNSDVVTLHTPYSPALYHLMDREKFALMKQGALFINTARGSLVDTDALLEELESGRLGGAGLDVIEGEELIQEERQLLDRQQSIERLQEVIRSHMLFRRENVIFTLHNAFNSKEALERILDTTVANIVSFSRGEPANVVRPEKAQKAV
jgi:D-lactate dehydrogenase